MGAAIRVVMEADVSQGELPVERVARILTLYAVAAESPVTVALLLELVSAGLRVEAVQPAPESPQFELETRQCCTS